MTAKKRSGPQLERPGGLHGSQATSNLRSAIVQDHGRLTVLLAGELDLATGASLYPELERLLDLVPRALVLDLRRLASIDSTGVTVLTTIREHALARGVPLVLRAPSRPVSRVLGVTALWEHFDTAPSHFEDELFEW